jgi:hypothetical protein
MSHVLSGICLAAAITIAMPGGRVLAEVTAPQDTAPDMAVKPERIAALITTMRIGEMLDVMRSEGLAYGTSLEDDMFGGNAGAGWSGTVGRIYDVAPMQRQIEDVLLQQFASDPAVLGDIEAFFSSDQGQRIVMLEVEARRAMLDDAAKEAAELGATQMTEDRDPRMDLLKRFAEVNDLIEMNVAGAMSSNLAFYRGMADEGAFDKELTEDQMLADVWAQEPQVRADSEKWLMSFLTLAYEPLADEDLEAYIAFSESASGQRLNAALFAAFDQVFRKISRDLGQAAARQMQGQDI